MFLRHEILQVVGQLNNFNKVILEQAENNIDTIIPGYTHLQRAEPIRFAHHLLAYFAMLQRDTERLMDSWKRINISPLGAGALAGSGMAIDSDYVALLLNFDDIYTNSLDAVSDRDFVVEFLAHAALIMMHLSKLSEEIILWSSQEFAYIQLDDTFCTGSSMLPQKKNPDVAELARGKTGRVYGALVGLLTVLKGLPLAYNKDLQEDKEGLFDTLKTVKDTLAVYTPMLATMHVNHANMLHAAQNDYSNATQIANYLVTKKIPFRKAHELTGQIVIYCVENKALLKNLPLEKYQEYCALIDADIYKFIDITNVIEAHQVKNGTAKNAIILQINQAKEKLLNNQEWLDQHFKLLEVNL